MNMTPQAKRFVQMLRDSDDANLMAREMITALEQYVEDLREDDPGDNEETAGEMIDLLEDSLEGARRALLAL